jgi:hypothetical protein
LQLGFLENPRIAVFRQNNMQPVAALPFTSFNGGSFPQASQALVADYRYPRSLASRDLS